MEGKRQNKVAADCKMTTPTFWRMLSGEALPPGKAIAPLAKALGIPESRLRRAVAADYVKKALDDYSIDIIDLCKGLKGADMAIRLPFVKQTQMLSRLDSKGHIKKRADKIYAVARDYGPNAYALLVEQFDLHPAIRVGDIAIVTPDSPVEHNLPHIVKTKNKLYCGIVEKHQESLVLMTLTPFRTYTLLKEDIVFASPISSVDFKSVRP